MFKFVRTSPRGFLLCVLKSSSPLAANGGDAVAGRNLEANTMKYVAIANARRDSFAKKLDNWK